MPIEIHPGQISLHHGLTIHGSGPNTTDDRRIAAVVRFREEARELEQHGYSAFNLYAQAGAGFADHAVQQLETAKHKEH